MTSLDPAPAIQRCPDCGALSTPWAGVHRPGCRTDQKSPDSVPVPAALADLATTVQGWLRATSAAELAATDTPLRQPWRNPQ